jgi:putative membrane protein
VRNTWFTKKAKITGLIPVNRNRKEISGIGEFKISGERGTEFAVLQALLKINMKTNVFFSAAIVIILSACNNNHSENNVAGTTDTTANMTQPADTMAENTSASATHKTMSDTAFLAKVYSTGLFEIEASKLAKRMTEHKKVKEFADMIIADHTALNNDAATLLKQKGGIIPDALPADLEAKMKGLKQWMGKDFEQKYAQANIDGHKDAIALFSEVSKYGDDAGVKNLATRSLPTLQKHEADADSLLVWINTPRKW